MYFGTDAGAEFDAPTHEGGTDGGTDAAADDGAVADDGGASD
jgi:hypothetical protein